MYNKKQTIEFTFNKGLQSILHDYSYQGSQEKEEKHQLESREKKAAMFTVSLFMIGIINAPHQKKLILEK